MKKTSAIPGNIAFKKAINQITRKTSEGKALPAFKGFLRELIRRRFKAKGFAFNEADVERELQEILENRREEGVAPGEIEKFKRAYAESSRRRPRTIETVRRVYLDSNPQKNS